MSEQAIHASAAPVEVIWGEELLGYAFGDDHPLNPLRLELTVALADELGTLRGPDAVVREPSPAPSDLLELVHDPAYVSAVRQAPDVRRGALAARFGLGTGDNPVFSRMHEAGALAAGASVAAAEAVWTGRARHAVNLAGGLHHAMRHRASGFCIYNDAALAIAWLLAQGAQRVAYVDVDVHHGDGVQAAFADDPRVLTVSLHETGLALFPGTGFPQETGRDGTSVNVALPPGTDDAGWLRAFSGVVPDVLRSFAPQVLVSQHGCDTHALDPLAHLELTVDGQRTAYAWLHRLAQELCGGRWVVLGGGGYALVQVVPRAWNHLLAEVLGRPLDPTRPTPGAWREFVRQRTGRDAPARLGDRDDPAPPAFRSWDDAPPDPADPLDRAVLATRRAIWPLRGLRQDV